MNWSPRTAYYSQACIFGVACKIKFDILYLCPECSSVLYMNVPPYQLLWQQLSSTTFFALLAELFTSWSCEHIHSHDMREQRERDAVY